MKKFTIKVIHETAVTYIVPAESFEDAKDKLCGKEIWAESGEEHAAVIDDDYCNVAEIEVYSFHTYGDPSPTGNYRYPIKEWEYWVDGDEE